MIHKLIKFSCLQTKYTLFNKPFNRAVIDMRVNITEYDWLVKLPDGFVNESTEIPTESLEDLKVNGLFEFCFGIK